MTSVRPTAILAVLAVVAVTCGRSDHVASAIEAPFVDATYAEALERAQRDGRIVVLDFTASWCPPCRAMAKSTWPDTDVQEWIGREAVALKIDVDREPELAGRMGVSSVPTIVFVDAGGRELGRFSGYRDPEAFLEEARTHARERTR